MKKHIVRQIIILIAVIVTIMVNGLANALPLNNQSTGEISDRFRVFFVPAGYVFSIWGLIYIGLILYAIFQAMKSQRENPRLVSTGYLFVLSCLANISWLFLWHYEQFVPTLVAMFALLGFLISIYLRLGIGEVKVSKGEKWFVHVPFSVYLGWITVATIANVTSTLDFVKWNGWGIDPAMWAVIMLVISAIVALVVYLTRKDIAYVLVIVWALLGIAVKQSNTVLVAATANVLAVLLAIIVVVSGIQGVLRRKE